MADKLVDDLRTDARLIREHVPNEDATARVLAGTEHANKLDKAADEITRLNALVDEMREGLEEIKELADTAPNCTEVQMIWESARDLITKASRDSGHG